MTTIKMSVHFTNALQQERKRLLKRFETIHSKIMVLTAERDSITDQVQKIDDQLNPLHEVPPVPEVEKAA